MIRYWQSMQDYKHFLTESKQISRRLQRAQEKLHEYFTYENFTSAQEKCIGDILSGRDVIALLPTGAGKPLCYQIPALCFEGLTIVVTPLVSLMHDQVAQMTRKAKEHGMKRQIPSAYIDSTQRGTKQILIDSAEGRYKLLYVTPERLKAPVFLRFVKKRNIDFLAVDEAHCISMWGYDFRPAYLELIKFIRCLDKRPVIGAFTATATRSVRDDIIRLLRLKIQEPVEGGFKRENLVFSVQKVRSRGEKKKKLAEYLSRHRKETGIIYCSTKEEAGRAGRDGKKAECLLYAFKNPESEEDYRICAGFLEHFRKSNEFDKTIARYRYKLGKYRLERMVEYCKTAMEKRTSGELQAFIENYFKEDLPERLHLSPEDEKGMQKSLEKQLMEIRELYYNNTTLQLF